MPVEEYHKKMMQIFEFYEKCAQEKRIQYYGITANQSLRLNEKIKRDL
jgi:hypothetical protein